MAAKPAGVVPMARLPMSGMAAEIVAIPSAVHGEAMSMPDAMSAMAAVVMPEMRKAMSGKAMSGKSMSGKSVAKKPMTVAVAAATGDGVALREGDDRKNVDAVASDLVEIIGLDPQAIGRRHYPPLQTQFRPPRPSNRRHS